MVNAVKERVVEAVPEGMKRIYVRATAKDPEGREIHRTPNGARFYYVQADRQADEPADAEPEFRDPEGAGPAVEDILRPSDIEDAAINIVGGLRGLPASDRKAILGLVAKLEPLF